MKFNAIDFLTVTNKTGKVPSRQYFQGSKIRGLYASKRSSVRTEANVDDDEKAKVLAGFDK